MAAGRGISFRSKLNADAIKRYEPLRRPGEKNPITLLKDPQHQPRESSAAICKGKESSQLLNENIRVPLSTQCTSNLTDDHCVRYISTQLYKLDGKDSEKLLQVVAAMKAYCSNEEQLKNLVNIIYKYSLEGKLNAHLGAIICHHLENLKVCNVKFRTVLLKLLQNDYDDRKLVYTQLNKFIMGVTFLCEIEYHMRLADGNRYVLFDEPIITYFIMLVDGGSEMEVETFVEQVAKCGKDLQNSKPEYFEKLLVKVRKKVVSESSITVSSRALLLETLEKILIEWKPISTSAKNFYELMSKPIVTICE